MYYVNQIGTFGKKKKKGKKDKGYLKYDFKKVEIHGSHKD